MNTWPTLQARLDNALSSTEDAIKQLQKVYPDAKIPRKEDIEQFEVELEEFEKQRKVR